eukprot:11591799-Prorocentrum_lima.AAC.1
MSEAVNQFKLQLRLATTDQATSNNLTARMLGEQRGPSWPVMRCFCDVHTVARVFHPELWGC